MVSMTQVIEFQTLARFTPTVKWTLDEQRGKVIPFMPQPEVSDELVCAAHEELDSDSYRWPERDETRLETLQTPWRRARLCHTY
jgi:hypothetical protein